MIADTYNSKGLKVEQIDKTIRDMDKVFDRYNESLGKKISATVMYHKILSKINEGSREIDIQEAANVESKANNLFEEYYPRFLNEDIPHILQELTNEGKVLNLASNTGFVEGTTLRKVLKRLDILKYFSFCIFSDEVETSKPSTSFFKEIHKKADVAKDKILHIGDNEKTDYRGALDFGFSALLIKPNYTLNDIRKRI